MSLKINNLSVSVENKEIIKCLSLEIKPGEIHVLMGPNGSGKSTLSLALMGHPKYKIDSGNMYINDVLLNSLSSDKRSKLGLFLSFQYPSEVSGVSISQFLRKVSGNSSDIKDFHKLLKEKANNLKADNSFISRYLNYGFSGGEKKKCEVLQMSIIKPKFAILDEVDSGVDIDSLKVIAENIKSVVKENNTGVLLITHYTRVLDYIKPDFVHVIKDGSIVLSGDNSLANELESSGYEHILGVADGS